MLQLVPPNALWRNAFTECQREWGPGVHEDGFGIGPADDIEADAGFATYMRKVTQARACTFLWIIEGPLVLGGLAVRHQEHPMSLSHGHIGFGLRESARGRGVASWALTESLTTARGLGLDRVLLVAAAHNVASRRTIERCGGVLEMRGVRPDEALPLTGLCRYWITVPDRPS